MYDWRWPLFVGFCWLVISLFRWLWPEPKEIWQFPTVLLIDQFAADKEWVLRHLELGGWKPPSPRDGIVRGSESLHPISLSDYDQTRPCSTCDGTGRNGRPTCGACRGTGWAYKPKSGSVAIGAGAIASTPARPLYRVQPGSSCKVRSLAVHDQFCEHIECLMREDRLPVSEQEWYKQAMDRAEQRIMRVVGVPSEHVGYLVKPGSICNSTHQRHTRNVCSEYECKPLPVFDKPPAPPRVRNAMSEARCGFCERPLAAHGPGRLCTAEHVEMLTK